MILFAKKVSVDNNRILGSRDYDYQCKQKDRHTGLLL
jgi:hypothetical protein